MTTGFSHIFSVVVWKLYYHFYLLKRSDTSWCELVIFKANCLPCLLQEEYHLCAVLVCLAATHFHLM